MTGKIADFSVPRKVTLCRNAIKWVFGTINKKARVDQCATEPSLFISEDIGVNSQVSERPMAGLSVLSNQYVQVNVHARVGKCKLLQAMLLRHAGENGNKDPPTEVLAKNGSILAEVNLSS